MSLTKSPASQKRAICIKCIPVDRNLRVVSRTAHGLVLRSTCVLCVTTVRNLQEMNHCVFFHRHAFKLQVTIAYSHDWSAMVQRILPPRPPTQTAGRYKPRGTQPHLSFILKACARNLFSAGDCCLQRLHPPPHAVQVSQDLAVPVQLRMCWCAGAAAGD